MIYSIFTCCVIKTKTPFVFFPQYSAPLLGNLIKVLFPPSEAKLTMDENLDFSLSWGRFENNFGKSYKAIDLACFFVYVIWWFNDGGRTL